MDDILSAAESVYDGWYADERIDWDDFIDRVESASGVDLGDSILSTEIKAIKTHINKYRKL